MFKICRMPPLVAPQSVGAILPRRRHRENNQLRDAMCKNAYANPHNFYSEGNPASLFFEHAAGLPVIIIGSHR
jgi:hypothetical protein